MEKKEQIEISCIGVSYIQPILDLYWKLSNEKFSGNSKIRVSSNENGYSVSIVALTVFCIESLLNNLKYHKKCSDWNVLTFFRREYPQYVDLAENLNELFTLRNVVAHNYIWKIKYEFDDNYNEINIRKQLQDGYGNLAFNNVIDEVNKVTQKLRLRIIPTRIGIKEAKQALLILKEFSDFLDKEEFYYISNPHFKYIRKIRSFEEIINIIK